MGIKNLWNVLQPYCERKPLFELQNKTVAVDLAGWVCEAMCVVNYEVQPRFYLRNLFFRTSYLLLTGVTPVFVLEGSAPALKYGVICKRIEAGPFAGQRPRPIVRHAGVDGQTNNPKKAAKGRSSFNRILKHCEELLTSMGVTCVQGPGEAEAFCAYLNRAGLVDGVVSQDSDCFAYGARRVYRNFSVASQGKTAAQGGMVEVYDMDKIEKSMDFGQQKMVAMALLCGCDYCPDGVTGIGRDAVFKFFGLYGEHEVLDRMREWRSKPDSKFEVRRHDRVMCKTCGHYGSEHNTDGCKTCGTSVKCLNSKLEPEQLLINQKQIKSETLIRRKALVDPQFPSEAIIDEFLVMPGALPASLDLRWKQPNVVKFVRLMHESVQWNDAYAMSKILPMLTRWQLFHLGAAVDNSDDEDDSDGTDTAAVRLAARASKVASMRGSVQPECIRKKRTPKGVASYEIVWKDSTGCFEGLFTDIQTDNYLREHELLGDSYTPWSTIEPVDLVERAYPELIEKFHALIQAKKKPVSRRIAAVAQLGVAQASLPARKRRAPRPAKLNSKQVSTNPGSSDATATSSRSPSDSLRANSKSTTKTPVMIDRFLQRMQARYVRKSTRKAELAAAAEAKTPVRSTAALRPRTFLSPVIRTSDQPMNLSQFSFGGDDSAAWLEEAENADVANVSAVIREMVNEQSTAMSFCGRRLRFETVLNTSDVYFMTIAQPVEDENDGVQLEVKAVAGSSSSKSKAGSIKVSGGKSKSVTSSPKKPIDSPGYKQASPKTPKALRGRPVAKIRYLHSYTDNNDVLISIPMDPDLADDPKAKAVGPWESEKLTFCNPFERLADDDGVNKENHMNGHSKPVPNVDGNVDEPMPLEADVPVADDSMDEFDRLVMAGQTARCPGTSAFVQQPPPAVTYIGEWSRIDVIDASGRVQSNDGTSATDLAAPLLQINGNADDLICSICSRIDPYNLHQCRVPVSADANVALAPPTSTPASEHADVDLYASGATPRTEFYIWGNVQIGHRSMCLNPGHQFQQYVDYWRHHHDFDDLTGLNINSLRHPPDVAMLEFNCELDAMRKADGGSHFGTSTPQTQDRTSRSRPKRRSSGTLTTTVLPAFDTRCTEPLAVSHFFQVADHQDLEWSFDDAVDNGASGKKDTFETCISLWHEPDAFRPADGDLVETMLNTPPPRHVDAAAAEAARQLSEERQQSLLRWRTKYGDQRRDFCDNEVRLMCRGKVSFKAKLVMERPHHNWDRVKGPHTIDDVLMAGPMTPSVLAGDRPDVSFPALSPDEPSSVQPHVPQRSAKRNGCEATANGRVSAVSMAAVASGSGTQLSNGTSAPSLATVIAATAANDSFTLNDSYVPVSKKLRNKLDSVE